MDNPKITINGKEIELPPIKARLWRPIMQFEEERKNISEVEGIDKYCEIIAIAFGVTKDEVLDNLELSDVLPKYFEVYKKVTKMLSAKIGKKNKEAEEQA